MVGKHFWSDNWLEHGLLKDFFPEFYSITTLPEAKLETLSGQHG